MPLSSEITKALSTLYHASASIEAVMSRSQADNRFTKAMDALEQLSRAHNIPIAIVGGLAAIRYGYPAVTEDIDVAIAQDQLSTLLIVAPDFGFQIAWRADSGWHTITYDDVELNVVPEGGRARKSAPTTIPGPVELGVSEGLGYANLPGWMELKISSGRRKDFTHVVEVLKASSAETIEQIREHLDAVHDDYLHQFNILAKEAEQEREQENERR